MSVGHTSLEVVAPRVYWDAKALAQELLDDDVELRKSRLAKHQHQVEEASVIKQKQRSLSRSLAIVASNTRLFERRGVTSCCFEDRTSAP